jgi:hypothetical protein
MHWIFEKLIFKGIMLQNIISFYLWNQELYLETKIILTRFEKKTNSWTPFTSNKCSSFATNLMMLKFWKNILHLLNWNYLKFETNPTLNLRKKTILNNNLKVCSWKSFHELHDNYLLHTTSFHVFFL